MNQIKDLMTTSVISVHPESLLVEAVNLLTKHKFNGLPVVNDNGVLVGMLNERDLVTNDSYVHLKTLFKLLNDFNFYKKDKSPIQEDLKKILDLKVSSVMNSAPFSLKSSANIEEAARMFGDPKINPLPIVDAENKVVGIISLSDLTKLYGVSVKKSGENQELDKQIDNFLIDFEKKFLFVSVMRTKLWFVTSILLVLIGFLIAMMLIVRISVTPA